MKAKDLLLELYQKRVSNVDSIDTTARKVKKHLIKHKQQKHIYYVDKDFNLDMIEFIKDNVVEKSVLTKSGNYVKLRVIPFSSIQGLNLTEPNILRQKRLVAELDFNYYYSKINKVLTVEEAINFLTIILKYLRTKDQVNYSEAIKLMKKVNKIK